MAKPEILVTGKDLVPDAVLDYLLARDVTPRRVRRNDLTEDELIEALDGAVGYLVGGDEQATDRVFEASSGLRAVAFVGTDYQLYVPGWRRARSLGISVVSTPGVNTRSVAEFTVMLILVQSRLFASVTDSKASAGDTPVGRTVGGKRLGIIGLGRIGREVARMARCGLGMEVGYSAPRRDESAEGELGIVFLEKEELLRKSHVLSLHRPGPGPAEGPELTGPLLDLMRPRALLVNTVHPDLVDPAALMAAIRSRDLRCAFDGRGEGPEWEALRELGPDRFLSVPTMAYNTADANEAAGMMAAQKVCDILDSTDVRRSRCTDGPE